jgi:diguanylate cyclase (GGDEF)-like protein
VDGEAAVTAPGAPAPVPGTPSRSKGAGLVASLFISAKIASIVAIVQLGLLFAFSSLSTASEIASGALFDSLLVAAVATPLIVFWVSRPYVAEREAAYDQMSRMNEMLRNEIDERMAAEAKLRENEENLELQLQEFAYVKELVEAQAADAVGMAEDLAIQKKAVEESEREKEYLANHDMLTGLPNRRHFEEMLARLKEAARSKRKALTLIYIDLDNFKTVNDTLGHQRGDNLLLEVADQLRDTVRETEFVARLGGDEFAILTTAFAKGSDDGIRRFAERLRASLAFPVKDAGREIPVSAALGIASCPDDAADAVGLLQAADRAMYAAKARGRNRVVLFSELEKAETRP